MVFAAVLFELLKDSPESLDATPLELSAGILIFRRGGDGFLGFDLEEPEAFVLSANGGLFGFDLELSCTRGGEVTDVDDEPGKVEDNPRFDGCVGRCFVCAEVVFGGPLAGPATQGVSGTGQSEEGCAGFFF